MAKKKIDKEVEVETLYTSFQACNIFQINKGNRIVTLDKFPTDTYTEKEWEKILRSEKLL